MYEYFSKKGLSESDVNTFFKNPDSSTGGICSYGADLEGIAQQLSEEQFKNHFGFEKFVELDGKKIYNPTLLADFFFETNKEGNVRNANYVKTENGGWKIIDGIVENGIFKAGKLYNNSLGTSILTYSVYQVNEYLKTKGLKVTEVAKQANTASMYDKVLSGVPETGVDTSVETLRPIVENALSEGQSVYFSIFEGHLINIETGEVKTFQGDGHAINIIGVDDNGFRASTYNKEWIYPFEDVRIGDILTRDGRILFNGSSVGYSAIKVEELGG